MNTKTTVDLNIIRQSPELFTWGAVIAIHTLGRYTFVEYNRDGMFGADHNISNSWYVYVDEKKTNYSASSLEIAMVYAISYANMDGPNEAGWMTTAAMKVLRRD